MKRTCERSEERALAERQVAAGRNEEECLGFLAPLRLSPAAGRPG